MKPRMYLQASRPIRLSRQTLDSFDERSPDAGATRGLRHVAALAMAMAMLLLPLGQQELLAQPPPRPAPGEWQDDPYNRQYAPSEQLGAGQQPASGEVYPQEGDGQAQAPAEPLGAERLEQLVAPIALYPDTLVAQVLAASTYSRQVADAAHWRLAQGYASAGQVAAGADAQNWDPSVKALTAFPQVLAQMDQNLQWTTDLGNAYYNQPQEVLQAVQVMRRRAQAAGTLQNTPQEAVSYDHGNIELNPADPQMVYVPRYDPWSVYGEPVSPYPGFSLLGSLGSFFGSSLGSSPISYGLGIAMSAFSHTPWGWLAWGLNWLSQSVLFNQSNYYSQSNTVADWGFPHGGGRLGGRNNPSLGRGIVPRPPQSYSRPSGGRGTTVGQGFVPRPSQSYRRPSGGRGTTVGQGFVPRPPQSYSRPGGGRNATLGRAFVPRPPTRYAMNRSGENFGRRAYDGVQAGYGSRQSAAYRSPQRAYRTPKNAVQRANFKPRSSVGRGFARSGGKSPHAGGVHPFGGGHGPKSFSGGRHFSSRQSGGSGHSGSHSGGRHHH